MAMNWAYITHAEPAWRQRPRIGLSTAALILLLLTHVWPWWLPAIRRDEDIWIAIAVGQLSFWPLFAGLVGVRIRRPVTCFLAGCAAGYGMLRYSRWQFGFYGYGKNSARDIEPFVYFGAVGAVVAIVVFVVCVRAMRKAERKHADRIARPVARSGALAGLAISSAVTLFLGVPWLCLASRWELTERGPSIAAVAFVGVAGLASASALWGLLLALVRDAPQLSWRRVGLLSVASIGMVIGIASWVLTPFVRHHRACESLAAAGVEVVTWDHFYGAKLEQRLEQFGITREAPFWSRWHKAYAPDVTSIRIDGKNVAIDGLASLADLRDDDLHVEVTNPDSENRILRELSTAQCVLYLSISFSASEDALSPAPGILNDEAFSHIAAIKDLYSLKLFNVRFTSDGLERLVGEVDLGTLHMNFCNVDNNIANVASKFEDLVSLALSQTEITDDGLRPLRELKKLDYLWLDVSHVRGDGLVHIAALPRLLRLSLQGCPITDDALRHLARLDELLQLDLRNTQVTGRGLRFLDRLPSLEQIDLDGAALDDAGLMSAASLPWKVKLNLGATPTLTLPGIILMHGERSRLRALPVGLSSAGEYGADAFDVDDAEFSELIVEPYEEWLREESSGIDSADDGEMVDAEMEFEHNTIILYHYGVSDERIEAYRRKVFGEPSDD